MKHSKSAKSAFFEMMFEIENNVFDWHFNSHCFILSAIYQVFFKEILFSKMRDTFFANMKFSLCI